MFSRTLLSLLIGSVASAAQDPSLCKENDQCDNTGLLQVHHGQEKPACRPRAPPKSALLVIDMQNDFINGSLPVPGAASIIPKINDLVALEGWSFIGFTLDYHPQNHASFAANSPLDGAGVFSNVKMQYTGDLKLCGREYAEIYGGSAEAKCTSRDVRHTFDQTLWPVHCVQHTVGQRIHSEVVVPASAIQVRKGYSSVVDSYGAFENNIEMVESNLPALLRLAGVEHVYTVGLALDYCVKHTSLQSARLFPTSVITDATRAVSLRTGDAALEELKANDISLVDTASLMTCK